MSCLTPNTMYRQEDGTTTFNKEKGYNPFSVPCGQCIGCRIDHSRDWALRCMHHAKQFKQNCFITLTFNEENLKGRTSVRTRDFTLFAKRLNSYLRRRSRPTVQYFHSTEYGEKRQRPHHHAILFGYFPPDAYEWDHHNGNIYYRSPELEKLWNYQGYVVVGQLSYQTAAYTAAYTFKKMRGKDYPDGVSPEKMTCSQGIGYQHFETYHEDWLRLGHIIFDEKRYRIPRAYLKRLDYTPKEKYLLETDRWCPLPQTAARHQKLFDLKLERELKAREDDILDREKKYRFLLTNQKNYKKKLCGDSALSEDNRYLKQLLALQIQIFNMSGEYAPEKQRNLHESIRRL